jgi:hypothetical protein
MTKLEMMRQAVKELGEATAADLAVFIEQKYGVKIDPKVIPILRASVRDKEMLESFHEKRRVAAEKETPNPPPGNVTRPKEAQAGQPDNIARLRFYSSGRVTSLRQPPIASRSQARAGTSPGYPWTPTPIAHTGGGSGGHRAHVPISGCGAIGGRAVLPLGLRTAAGKKTPPAGDSRWRGSVSVMGSRREWDEGKRSGHSLGVPPGGRRKPQRAGANDRRVRLRLVDRSVLLPGRAEQHQRGVASVEVHRHGPAP